MRKLAYLSFLALALAACALADGNKNWPEQPVDSYSSLTQQEREQHLYQDTVTPPINPLVPPTEDTYTTKGVLLFRHSDAHGTRPALKTLRSETYFYLLEDSYTYATFGHALLRGLHTGDTIAVTGETRRVGTGVYGILMTEIKLLAPYQRNDEDGEKGDEE